MGDSYKLKPGRVKTFQKDKEYILNKSKIDNKQRNKWIDYIKDPFVEIRLLGLGFILIEHPEKGLLDYPVYPSWCSEITYQ